MSIITARRYMLFLFINLAMAFAAFAQPTAINFQGFVKENSVPANGLYDIEFQPFLNAVGTTSLANAVVVSNVSVVNGIFAVNLDFALDTWRFNSAFIEIKVKPVGSGTFVTLSPRQQVTTTPFAANARLVAGREIIQPNGLISASTGFSVGSNRVLGTPGSNVIVGINAGPNTTGSAGSGAGNSFFGNDSGRDNTLGQQNTFVGNRSGYTNVDGIRGTFLGYDSGKNNVSGWDNVSLGYSSGFGSGDLTFATAIGSGARVDTSHSLVLGRIASPGSQGTKVGIGTTAPTSDLHLVGSTFILQRLGTQIGPRIRADAARGTAESPTASQLGDTLFSINATGHNGTAFSSFAPGGISVIANENFAPGAHGTRLDLNTAIRGTEGSSRRMMTITDVGVSIGSSSTNATTSPAHSLTVGSGTNLNVASAELAVFGTSGAYATVQDNTSQVQAIFGADNSPSGGVDGSSIYGSMTPHGIQFRTNNSLKMTLTHADGFLGIGTGTPVDRLDAAGDIRIGTGTSGCVKDRNGTIITGTCSSDIRLKKNLLPFGSVLKNFSLLKPMTFDWRADEFKDRHFGTNRSFGLIAQDVELAFPDLVSIDEKGFKTVNYSKLPLITIQAVNELIIDNQVLREKLNEQRAELDTIKAILCLLMADATICQK